MFLTNTLEPIEPQKNLLLPAVTAEVEAAQNVKDKPILVITGNPPYYGLSKNRGPHATALIERYKYVDGVHFGERKHWLLNDYVKFLAFAQAKMDEVEEGIVAAITDNSYLDNPTFRGMRQSLLQTFNEVYIVDLHGNVEKREIAPGGELNENVFDIKQGVSICMLVKRKELPRHVYHLDRWGSRLAKYEWLAETKARNATWTALRPTSPYYFLKPYSEVGRQEYDQFYSVSEIFRIKSIGITTSRDGLLVAPDDDGLRTRLGYFLNPGETDEQVKARFSIDDNENWSVAEVRASMFGEAFDVSKSIDFCYAPFDVQKLYLDDRLVFRPRYGITRPLLRGYPALIVNKIARDDPTAYVVSVPVGHKAASRYDPGYVFPLFVQHNGRDDLIDLRENLDPTFRAFIDARYDHHYSPEQILGYIYAVLHAPAYRTRYAEFLRIDFPRIPFAGNRNDFETLSDLGWKLIQVHLLREAPGFKLGGYHGKGGHVVESVRYSELEQVVWINKDQCFKPIPQNVWDFHIGGYRVLEKYLKSRKGRTLSLDEIDHVAAIADALAFTIEQMARIDTAYRAAFPGGG